MKVKHWCSGDTVEAPIKDIVHDVLSYGNGDISGALEILECKLEVLTKAFSVLVEHIGEEAAEKIINNMICPIYHCRLPEKEGVTHAAPSVQPEPFFPRGE